jgi:hypothetical protein
MELPENAAKAFVCPLDGHSERYGRRSDAILHCPRLDPAAALYLLERGANLNSVRDPDFRTPLIVASEAGDAALVELYLARGANPNVVDRTGRTPLSVCRNGKCVALLLEKAIPRVSTVICCAFNSVVLRLMSEHKAWLCGSVPGFAAAVMSDERRVRAECLQFAHRIH